jgi:NAD(P)-dependent dehydrogenase (short-subunit alcohol dehydrogenase family)
MTDWIQGDQMFRLAGKTMVVIGGSRGVGRRIAESGARQGAQVLAVARHEAALRQLAQDVPGIKVLALDASQPNAPSEVFRALVPDILVVGGGAIPVTAPLMEQSWRDFTVNWESDVRIAFHFCKAALSRPLPAETSVILIASCAALAGSPLTGGYAGAKRTQMFIANYSQKESDRLGLGLQFVALAPGIIPETEFGKLAVDGYARYIGMSTNDFIRGMASPPSQSDVANAVIELAACSDQSKEKMFIVTGEGLERASLCKW